MATRPQVRTAHRGRDLNVWTEALCLDGAMADDEPKKLRWALWHTAGEITTSARAAAIRATWSITGRSVVIGSNQSR